MRRIRQYPQGDEVRAYLPDVAKALGVPQHNSFRTVREYAQRYHTETGGVIEVIKSEYFTCVLWEQLRPFATWFQEHQSSRVKPAPKPGVPRPHLSIPKFSGFMHQRVLDASLRFGEKMVELGHPEAAFLFFEQPEGRGFSTGNIRYIEGEHED